MIQANHTSRHQSQSGRKTIQNTRDVTNKSQQKVIVNIKKTYSVVSNNTKSPKQSYIHIKITKQLTRHRIASKLVKMLQLLTVKKIMNKWMY